LQFFQDEAWLSAAFAGVHGVVGVKVIRNKATGVSEGFGFVTFASRADAESALAALSHSGLRLNWAQPGAGSRRSANSANGGAQDVAAGGAGSNGSGGAGGVGGAGTSGGGATAPLLLSEHSLFVGDIAPDVSDATLADAFRSRYPLVRSAKVVTDAATQRSKGFGFVRFGSAAERDDALVTMNGVPCGAGGRPMRISLAAPKKPPGANGMPPQGMLPPLHHGHPGGGGNGGRGSGGGAVFYNPHPAPGSGVGPDGGADPHNTTVFVGGLDAAVSEEELRAVFEQFGELVYVKIPHGKNCGAPRTAAQQLHVACCAAASLRVARARIAAPAHSRLFSCSVCARAAAPQASCNSCTAATRRPPSRAPTAPRLGGSRRVAGARAACVL
jgi:RNA recognition motif-containing protein